MKIKKDEEQSLCTILWSYRGFFCEQKLQRDVFNSQCRKKSGTQQVNRNIKDQRFLSSTSLFKIISTAEADISSFCNVSNL